MKRGGNLQRKTPLGRGTKPLKRGGELGRGTGTRGQSGNLSRSALSTTNRKPMAKRSPKRVQLDHEYTKARRELLERNPTCFYRFEGCTTVATDADHIVPRGLAPHRIADITNLNPACRSCHDHRHNGLTREERQALGLGIYADPAG